MTVCKTQVNETMQNKLDAYKHDHKVPQYRGGENVGGQWIDKLVKWFFELLDTRASELDPELLTVEEDNAHKMRNPRSLFIADAFKAQCEGLGSSESSVKGRSEAEEIELRNKLFRVDDLKSPLVPFELMPKVAVKSSGPPEFVSKREWFDDGKNQRFLRDLERTIMRGKIDQALQMVYAAFSGFRTQTARKWKPPKEIEAKLRAIWMICAAVFYFNFRVVRGVIVKAKELFDIGKLFPVYVYYVDKSETAAKFKQVMSEADSKSVTVLDARAFDHFVRRQEITANYKVFCEESLITEFVMRFATDAELIHPWGIVVRKIAEICGQLSGMVDTNIWDSINNVCDIYAACVQAGFAQFIKCIFVNGDDIVVVWKTHVDKKNIEFIARFTYRILEPDKSWFSLKSAYYSKHLYKADGTVVRSIALIINRLCYTERSSDPDVRTKEYIWVAVRQLIMEVDKSHPWYTDFVNFMQQLLRYKRNELDEGVLKRVTSKFLESRYTPDDSMPDVSEYLGTLEAVLP